MKRIATPDAAITGAVGTGGMKQMAVVLQRGLAGLQLDGNRVVFVNVDGDLLAAAEQVVGGERVDVRDDAAPVAARHEPHAAAVDGGR